MFVVAVRCSGTNYLLAEAILCEGDEHDAASVSRILTTAFEGEGVVQSVFTPMKHQGMSVINVFTYQPNQVPYAHGLVLVALLEWVKVRFSK